MSPDSMPMISVTQTAWRKAVPGLEVLICRLYRASQYYGGKMGNPFPSFAPPSIILSDNARVKALNARFRGRNKATNVLTFSPLFSQDSLYNGGEIILAFGVVWKEAQESGKSFRAHFSHLIVHGLLHLKGHDHHQAGEARKMEAQETRILRAVGMADPWKRGRERKRIDVKL